MKLFSDNMEYTGQIFPENISALQETQIEKFNTVERSYLQDLYEQPKFFFGRIPFDDFWKYAFLAKFAPRSQFDTIRNLNRQNISLPSASFFLADSGNGFHGFHKRRWKARSGNIHLCVNINPDREIEQFHPGLMIIGTISVLQTIDTLKSLKDKTRIRWLNDIFIDGKKVGGVLTHSQTQGQKVNGALIGIGLNVLSEPGVQNDGIIRQTTSLHKYSAVDLSVILQVLLQKIKINYEMLLAGNYRELFAFYRERSEVIGKKVAVYSDPVNGVCTKMGEDTVLDIRENLELEMENAASPLKKGRIVILE